MNTRNRFGAAAAAIALLTAGLSACEDGRVRPPPVSVRAVHVAPTAPPVELYRVEVPADGRDLDYDLDFRGVSPQLTFDEDEYEFSARTADLAAGRQTVLTRFTQNLTADNEYLFVLTEIGGAVAPIVVENPVFDSDSETQVGAVHAAPGLAGMDVYIEPPGADLTTATPLGSVEFGDVLDPATREPGDYRLTLTAQGDPADVRFSSGDLELPAGAANTFVIADSAGDGVAPFSVVGAGPSPGLLLGTSVRSGVQFVNAAADRGARDAFVDGDYTAPVVPALAFGAASDLALLSPGTRDLSVTPAGNPGVVEDEQELAATRGVRYTALIGGEPGDVTLDIAQNDNRHVTGHARLRIMNGASQYSPLDVFLVEPGTDTSNLDPSLSLAAPDIGPRRSVPPGDYELVLRDGDTDAVVYGPAPLTLAAGVYTILAVNGAASGTVDVVLLEDFN
ncbi:MAG: DUF4397 domain-containing protein [Gammaproteobacteria bacterium]|nr:DUF4397 domain-containing protein [Gammaproteobacteria bacterium]